MRTWRRILLFFCLFAGWAFALDRLIDAGLRRVQTSHYGVINRTASGSINADIIISGSSRALVHYDPVILQEISGLSAYNLGADASHIDMQLAVLKLYLKHNKRPSLVIQNLDMHSLEPSEVLYEGALFKPYVREDEELFAAIQKIEPDAWKWRVLPLYGYATEDVRFSWLIGLGALCGFQPPEDCIRGFRPSDQTWTGAFDRFRKKNPDGVSYEINPAGIAALEELIQLCKTNQIALLLSYSPQYEEMLNLVKNRSEVFSQFRRMARDFDVPLWDFTDSFLCRDKYYFYNSQHMNRRGASEFSTQLAHRIRYEIIPALGKKAKSSGPSVGTRVSEPPRLAAN
jgi:hypothetical protein